MPAQKKKMSVVRRAVEESLWPYSFNRHQRWPLEASCLFIPSLRALSLLLLTHSFQLLSFAHQAARMQTQGSAIGKQSLGLWYQLETQHFWKIWSLKKSPGSKGLGGGYNYCIYFCFVIFVSNPNFFYCCGSIKCIIDNLAYKLVVFAYLWKPSFCTSIIADPPESAVNCCALCSLKVHVS